MKILLVNKYFFPKGGADRVFLDYGKLLNSKGHDVSFFSMKHPMNLDNNYEGYFISEVDYEQSSPIGNIKQQ